MQYDFLILGQGLAGSLLAWRLLQAGQNVLVIDDGLRHSSSKVAAGLVNPLAGLRFNHSPWVWEWLQSARELYADLARHFGEGFWHDLPMLRVFRSAEQIRFYERQRQNPIGQAFLNGRFSAQDCPQPVHAPWGGFMQRHTGFLRIPSLLWHLRRMLCARRAFVREHVDDETVHLTATGVAYRDLQARHLIFCRGYRDVQNAWFDFLPFSLDKGAILTLAPVAEGKGPWPDVIINGAHWLLPLPEGQFRLGATHEHRQFDEHIHPAQKQQLLEGLHKLVLHPDGLRVVAHQAGVRPSTVDRQPFLGTHPRYACLHVFNGFGAHGSLSIPWYSQVMCDWLLHRRPLPEHCAIFRFVG